MSLWVDKYKPKTIDQLTYHNGLSKQLKRMAATENIPHLLFYGPPGAGKKTRIAALLRELFGPGAEKLKVDQRQFQTTSGRKMLFSVISSNYHLELNPSDLGMHDRVIVQDLIKASAQTQQVDARAKHAYKVIVIDQADKLTREAQAALRRTMEKYTSSLRLVLCCNTLSKIIAPVRSRCLLMRIPRPSISDISTGLLKVAHSENIALPESLAKTLAEQSHRDMRAALLTLEETAVRYPDLSQVSKAAPLDWQLVITKIVKAILSEQTPEKLLSVRTLLYELITRCIEPSVVLKCVAFELSKSVPDPVNSAIIDYAAFHEHRLVQGKKAIIHLEAFVARAMDIYKKHLNSM